jgi:hypothetical protein
MSTPVPVGFSQRLQLDWLEHTATLVLAGHTRDHIVTTLQDLLRHELSVGGMAPRGNREKAITMLLRIWVLVPRHLWRGERRVPGRANTPCPGQETRPTVYRRKSP